MTGTDQPTVVRNPKIKVKIKTAPQQTTRYARGSLRPENHLRTHLHRHRSATWHVPKYMREPDILTAPGRLWYSEAMSKAVLLALILDTILFAYLAITGAEKLAAIAAVGMFGGAIYLNRWASSSDEDDER